VTPLEQELIELGNHLDHGDLQLPTAHPRRPALRVFQIAAVLLVVLAAFVAAFAPARRAVARWFGIGVVEVRTSPTTLPLPSSTSTIPVVYSSVATVTSVSAQPGSPAPDPLASARVRLVFAPSLPSVGVSGPVQKVSVDGTIPGGLLMVRFSEFTLVEVGTTDDSLPVMTKVIGQGTTVEEVVVAGHPGLWLAGTPHQIAMMDRDGNFRLDTVRQEGNVLLWVVNDVTFRIEGLSDKAQAIAIANTIV
jgi:hypothetical protein